MEREDEIALAAATFIVLSTKKRRKRKHKCWVKPSLPERDDFGVAKLLSVLKKDDLCSRRITNGSVQNFCRMSSSDLEWLLGQVAPRIQKEDTNYRKAIPQWNDCLSHCDFLQQEILIIHTHATCNYRLIEQLILI
ncbi:unnamed protein product [Callosobruchus maculatus]|uniref:Uncharacterized protein n=1 Tax=Callosobruchus maculatus TaxID=64391 RepID=A0A653CYZ0_CALMS|nr:unnamed protein product [Callosobruchus maculatus]